MNQLGQCFDVLRRDRRRRFFTLRWSRQCRSHAKQSTLNSFGPLADLVVCADAAGKAQNCIQLVHSAIRLNAEVCLRNAHAAGQPGLSPVTTCRSDTHISSPCTSSFITTDHAHQPSDSRPGRNSLHRAGNGTAMADGRAVRSRLLPRPIFRVSMQRTQHGSEHTGMSNDCNLAATSLRLQREKLHFLQDPPFKVVPILATWRCQARIIRNPTERVGLVSTFDLFPSNPFPSAKANLAQRWPHMPFHAKRFSNRLCRRTGTEQVAGIDNPDLFLAKSVDKLTKLRVATRVQIGIGLSTKRSCHIGLGVTNEKKFAHTIHTPQK